MSVNDPGRVRREYECERGLKARRAAHARADGPDPSAIVYSAVAEFSPTNVLEVGCGTGDLASRMTRELNTKIVATDQSPRMVELTRRQGVNARIADVEDLPFDDGAFDCVVAAWVLYHARSVARALDEIVRVLTPRGRLVAATSYPDDLRELFEFLSLDRVASEPFNGANAPALLRERFCRVEARDALGSLTFVDDAAIRAYVEPSAALFDYVDVPPCAQPLVVRRRMVIFVADRA